VRRWKKEDDKEGQKMGREEDDVKIRREEGEKIGKR
jgi:hypothetical protein